MNNEMEIVFGIFDAIGSLATLGAFIYLFKKDNEKQSQINSLLRLAQVEEKKLKLIMLPDIRREGTSLRPGENRINIQIQNIGEYARLTKFEIESEHVLLDQMNLHLPYHFDKGKDRLIFLQGNGTEHLSRSLYIVYVYYSDKLGNGYKMKISGVGSDCTIDGYEECEL